MNDTTNPARRLRHGDRPTAPLRWNDRWTLLLTGPTMGLIGPLGSTWPNQSAEYERVDVCAIPTGASAFPERDPNKPAEEQGLFNKFIVMRTDGKDAPGEKHHGCAYFVLDLDHDRHAAAAMRAYAAACIETHPALAADLLAKFGKLKLDDIEQYRLQMAAIGTASLGYWKEGDSIHPDYDTVPLRDVARLYAKYEALFKFREQVNSMLDQVFARDLRDEWGRLTIETTELENALRSIAGHPAPSTAPDQEAKTTLRGYVPTNAGNMMDMETHEDDNGAPTFYYRADQVDPLFSAAPARPQGWEISADRFSAPGTIRLNNPKWGGCFLPPPAPHDIGLHALAYRLLRDMLDAAPAQPAAPDAVDTSLTDEEQAFVELVRQRPGHKLNSGEARGADGADLWARPQALGLIQAVGSYKWIVPGAQAQNPVGDAVEAAMADAIMHGTGAFRVHSDGSTEHVDLRQAADMVRPDVTAADFTPPGTVLSEEARRHYAELAAFPPKLQRDALYQDYAVPKPEGDPK